MTQVPLSGQIILSSGQTLWLLTSLRSVSLCLQYGTNYSGKTFTKASMADVLITSVCQFLPDTSMYHSGRRLFPCVSKLSHASREQDWETEYCFPPRPLSLPLTFFEFYKRERKPRPKFNFCKRMKSEPLPCHNFFTRCWGDLCKSTLLRWEWIYEWRLKETEQRSVHDQISRPFMLISYIHEAMGFLYSPAEINTTVDWFWGLPALKSNKLGTKQYWKPGAHQWKWWKNVSTCLPLRNKSCPGEF